MCASVNFGIVEDNDMRAEDEEALYDLERLTLAMRHKKTTCFFVKKVNAFEKYKD